MPTDAEMYELGRSDERLVLDKEITRLRAALAEEEQDAEYLRIEGARLRAQLTTEVNTSQGYRKLYDEAQREVERLKGMHQTVLRQYEELGDETEALEARCARLEACIHGLNATVTCYPSGSTVITPTTEVGVQAFWGAVRAVCALAEGQA